MRRPPVFPRLHRLSGPGARREGERRGPLQNSSVYEISEALQERHVSLSPTAVREVLREEGFAPLPRRLDDERPAAARPTVEPVADVRQFDLHPRTFPTRCGGLFLFLPDWVRLGVDELARSARLRARR